jgi:hypothetical protein
VEDILNHRDKPGPMRECLVRWKDFDVSHDSWVRCKRPQRYSGFWIDGFIETACLRVIAIAESSFLSSLRFKTPLENRKKGIQIYTVVFSLK